MSRYIFYEKPRKSAASLFGGGADRESVETINTNPLTCNTIGWGRNWAYLRFCILSFLHLRPSHFFLIILNTNLWDNKTS